MELIWNRACAMYITRTVLGRLWHVIAEGGGRGGHMANFWIYACLGAEFVPIVEGAEISLYLGRGEN